uniref:Uncharacterized protein n=1 Tax=viral metagenome TaxID=1070528 RepID=A0A6C0LHT3_9ZZZZ
MELIGCDLDHITNWLYFQLEKRRMKIQNIILIIINQSLHSIWKTQKKERNVVIGRI